MTLTALPPAPPYPTNTPYPTYTYYPTITPSPTVSFEDAFVRWNMDQVISAYQAAGLQLGAYRPMTRDDYAGAPVMSLQATCLYISPSAGACDGRVFSFLDQTSLEKTRDFYVSIGINRTYINRNILVVINPEISEDTARQFESLLVGLQ